MKPAAFLAFTVLAAAPAIAQNTISWVSRSGSDANPCTITQPCLTFQGAYNKTNAGGIIKAMDAADYGRVDVHQAITIDGNGVGAEIEVTGIGSSVLAIEVFSGAVTIRDLTIHVATTAPFTRGIYAASGDTHIENVVITGAPSDGVDVVGNVTAKNLTVTGAKQYGVYIAGGSASIRDSVIRGAGTAGIYVLGGNFAPGVALIERTEMSFNGIGLLSDNLLGTAATARIADSTITSNTTGISAINGGQIVTFRTNMLAGNTTDGATPFSVSLK